ncbi:MAG: hypothetical protein AAAB35_15795 [Phyllobacterium sp.]|uniref:hypothetical protein n=1 Tax=Phyllobacterium sp. TaxID=1871046 RepID=UPI0030F2766E
MRRLRKHSYSSEDWNLMQRAHFKASKQLQRCPKSHADADRLARRVMTLFDEGLRDEAAIVSAAVFQENLITEIMTNRYAGGYHVAAAG